MHTTTQRLTRWAVVGLLAAVAVGAWGCRRHRPAIHNGQLSERYERSLLRLASRETGCEEAMLSPALLTRGDPAVYTVSGCQQPVEYWLRCRTPRAVRCDWERVTPLAETAAANMQCTANAMSQQPTQQPTTRYASGCGRQAPFTISCNAVGCGWAMSGPIEGAGPPVAAGDSQVAVQTGQPGQGGAPGQNLQQQLMTQRDAIMSCLDDVSGLALTLRWTAQGQVILQIPQELTNTAAEGCIRAAVGALQVPPQAQPGEVTVNLQ